MATQRQHPPHAQTHTCRAPQPCRTFGHNRPHLCTVCVTAVVHARRLLATTVGGAGGPAHRTAQCNNPARLSSRLLSARRLSALLRTPTPTLALSLPVALRTRPAACCPLPTRIAHTQHPPNIRSSEPHAHALRLSAVHPLPFFSSAFPSLFVVCAAPGPAADRFCYATIRAVLSWSSLCYCRCASPLCIPPPPATTTATAATATATATATERSIARSVVPGVSARTTLCRV